MEVAIGQLCLFTHCMQDELYKGLYECIPNPYQANPNPLIKGHHPEGHWCAVDRRTRGGGEIKKNAMSDRTARKSFEAHSKDRSQF